MVSSFLRRWCVVVAFCCAAMPAHAQQPPPGRADRPYRGLFGGGVGETEQSWSANASLGAAFDNNVLAVVPPKNAEEASRSAFEGRMYEYLSAGTAYSLSKRRVSFNASLATSGQYVPAAASPFVPSYSLGAGGSLQLSRRSSVSASHLVSISPYNALLIGPAIGDPVLGGASVLQPILGVTREQHVIQTSTLGFNRQIGRRASFSIAYTRSADVPVESKEKIASQNGTARFSFGLTKGLSAYVGYAMTEAQFGKERMARSHNVDAGVDFNQSRGISITRRTHLVFGGGTSAITAPADPTITRLRAYYRLTANATLTREIARSWAANIAYSRGLSFVSRFRQPFLSDSITMGLGGLLSRRVEFFSSAGATYGKVGLFSTANGFSSYVATAGINTGLTRYLSLGTEVSRYQYRFERSDSLPFGLPPEMGRMSARVYLSVWAPLLHVARKGDASR